MTPLRWSACTAARGFVLCILAAGLTLTASTSNFGYHLLPPSWSRYGEVSFFLGTDDPGRDVLNRLLSGSCANRRWRICGDACATICGLGTGHLRRGDLHGYAQRVLNHILIPYWRIPSLLLGNYRCSVCRIEFVSRHVCCLAGAAATYGSVRFTAWCTTNWKRVRYRRSVWMAHQR